MGRRMIILARALLLSGLIGAAGVVACSTVDGAGRGLSSSSRRVRDRL